MRPLCRYCGKPLAKRTERLYCHREPPNTESQRRIAVIGEFCSRDDLKKATNKEIASVTYYLDNQHNRERGQAGTVFSFTTWDGESYESVNGEGFFDTLRCAAEFAGVFARLGKATTAYNTAVIEQQRKEATP